jgi:hypothetical protein
MKLICLIFLFIPKIVFSGVISVVWTEVGGQENIRETVKRTFEFLKTSNNIEGNKVYLLYDFVGADDLKLNELILKNRDYLQKNVDPGIEILSIRDLFTSKGCFVKDGEFKKALSKLSFLYQTETIPAIKGNFVKPAALACLGGIVMDASVRIREQIKLEDYKSHLEELMKQAYPPCLLGASYEAPATVLFGIKNQNLTCLSRAANEMFQSYANFFTGDIELLKSRFEIFNDIGFPFYWYEIDGRVDTPSYNRDKKMYETALRLVVQSFFEMEKTVKSELKRIIKFVELRNQHKNLLVGIKSTGTMYVVLQYQKRDLYLGMTDSIWGAALKKMIERLKVTGVNAFLENKLSWLNNAAGNSIYNSIHKRHRNFITLDLHPRKHPHTEFHRLLFYNYKTKILGAFPDTHK